MNDLNLISICHKETRENAPDILTIPHKEVILFTESQSKIRNLLYFD